MPPDQADDVGQVGIAGRGVPLKASPIGLQQDPRHKSPGSHIIARDKSGNLIAVYFNGHPDVVSSHCKRVRLIAANSKAATVSRSDCAFISAL